MKKSRTDPTNLARICAAHGVDVRLVEQRMRLKNLTLEEAIARPRAFGRRTKFRPGVAYVAAIRVRVPGERSQLEFRVGILNV